jgi:hypothetical protein
MIVRDNTTTRFTFARTTGNFTATGEVSASSDERLKSNWQALPADFVERLAEVKNGTFDRTDTGQRQVGVSAQSLQGLLPEAVHEDAGGYLAVSYGHAALAAVVELAREVTALRAELKKLKGEV